jgi:hypothetical protein
MTVALGALAAIAVVWFILAGAGRLDRYERELEREWRDDGRVRNSRR